MKVKQKITKLILATMPGMLLSASFLTIATPTISLALEKCGGVETAIIKCDQNNQNPDLESNGLWGLLLIAINVLTAGVAIAAIGGIVYGSVLYASAANNSGQVQKAREIITNVVIGIVAYVGMFALLQFIIPGGVFT